MKYLTTILTLIALTSAVRSQETKVFEFYDTEGLKYSYLYHIEIKDGGVTGDITTRRLDDDDPELQQMIREGKASPAEPIASTSFQGKALGLRLSVTFDSAPPYNLPAREKDGLTTTWNMERTPNGMVLIVPRSVVRIADFDSERKRLQFDDYLKVPEMKVVLKREEDKKLTDQKPAVPAAAPASPSDPYPHVYVGRVFKARTKGIFGNGILAPMKEYMIIGVNKAANRCTIQTTDSYKDTWEKSCDDIPE